VFNNKSGAFLTHNPTFHDFSSQNTLLRIEIGRRLVDQVNVARLGETEHERNALQLTTRQGLDIVLKKLLDVKWHNYFRLENRSSPDVL
jgi:hypothetical protein